MLNVRCSMFDVRCSMFNFFWILDSGFFLLSFSPLTTPYFPPSTLHPYTHILFYPYTKKDRIFKQDTAFFFISYSDFTPLYMPAGSDWSDYQAHS